LERDAEARSCAVALNRIGPGHNVLWLQRLTLTVTSPRRLKSEFAALLVAQDVKDRGTEAKLLCVFYADRLIIDQLKSGEALNLCDPIEIAHQILQKHNASLTFQNFLHGAKRLKPFV
jgi:hypothetical protein